MRTPFAITLGFPANGQVMQVKLLATRETSYSRPDQFAANEINLRVLLKLFYERALS